MKNSRQNDNHDHHIRREHKIGMARRRSKAFCGRDTFSRVNRGFDSIPRRVRRRRGSDNYRILSSIDFEDGKFPVAIDFIARGMFNGTFKLSVRRHALEGVRLGVAMQPILRSYTLNKIRKYPVRFVENILRDRDLHSVF